MSQSSGVLIGFNVSGLTGTNSMPSRWISPCIIDAAVSQGVFFRWIKGMVRVQHNKGQRMFRGQIEE